MNEPIVVGIDISKEFSDLCVLSPRNEVILETKVFHNNDSMGSAVSKLKILQENHKSQLVAVMESTAHYHRLLQQYLQKSGIEVIVINPLQSGGIKNLQIRKIKNDQTDAKRLAFLYRLQVLKGTAHEQTIFDSLKDLTRQRTDIVSERTKFSNKLTGLLDQAFPGYKKMFSGLKSKTSLTVLINFPTPMAVLNAKKDLIKKAISEGCGRNETSKFVTQKTDELIIAAKEAIKICVVRESFGHLISLNASLLSTLQQTADDLEQKIIDLAATNDDVWSSVKLLTSIPGIGEYSAIVILSEIGDISKFSKPKQLVAFCGLDPAVKQSGNYSSIRNKISKRGSSYLRNILDICTHVAVHPGKNKMPANPVLAVFYNEKHSSKPANVALCACMHKMVNIIFAVLRDRKSFELRTPDEHVELMTNRAINGTFVA